MNTVYFVRHGQSQANVEGVYAGTSDSPLTDKGRQNARVAAKSAKALGIATIISSDLERAYETAGIIADIVGIDRRSIVQDKRLREVDVGQLTGQREPGAPGAEHMDLPAYADYCQSKSNAMGVEYLGNVRQRMESLVGDLDVYATPILLVGHDMSGRVLKQVFEGVPVEPARLQSFLHDTVVEFTRPAV